MINNNKIMIKKKQILNYFELIFIFDKIIDLLIDYCDSIDNCDDL